MDYGRTDSGEKSGEGSPEPPLAEESVPPAPLSNEEFADPPPLAIEYVVVLPQDDETVDRFAEY